GDEFGLVGADGEASRTPMPWGTEDDGPVAERIALYRDLIALRNAHPALQTGGFRWLHVDDETVVFARESAEETVLVLATRGDADAALDAGALPGAAEATAVFGDATLGVAEDGAVLLSADGPAFAVWTLPGVALPAPAASAASPDLTDSTDSGEVSRGVVDADTPTPASEVREA
ncbi:DUF3459 domain-containing protein, partial [Microbacterium sp.]|uniref:DUF3459 domain-containing protein n=1 Tax=Microbacterium sp. TaxID=51671 RepID=UPI0035AFD537